MHLEYVQSFQHEYNFADVVVIASFIWYISGCQFKLMFLVHYQRVGGWVRYFSHGTHYCTAIC